MPLTLFRRGIKCQEITQALTLTPTLIFILTINLLPALTLNLVPTLAFPLIPILAVTLTQSLHFDSCNKQTGYRPNPKPDIDPSHKFKMNQP